MRKITEEGAEFVSHLDGKKLFLSPERAIEIQENLGADIIMSFDEKEQLDGLKEGKMHIKEKTKHYLELYKDGMYKDLRKMCVEEMTKMDFDRI